MTLDPKSDGYPLIALTTHGEAVGARSLLTDEYFKSAWNKAKLPGAQQQIFILCLQIRDEVIIGRRKVLGLGVRWSVRS